MSIITNSTKPTLEEFLRSAFPLCNSLDFLVGYFYFSGFDAIQTDELEKIPMRVLVGLDAEKGISNVINEISPINMPSENHSISEIKEQYYARLCDIFNNTEYFDNKINIDKFDFFLKKISDGTLEIKKTLEPNHAKMYVLSYKENNPASNLGVTPGVVIIGSSNLSINGLSKQFEINSVTTEKAEHEEAIKIFNMLWDSAITLVDKNTFDDFKKNVLDNIWHNNIQSPFLMYLKVLDEYFSLEISRNIKTPKEINENYSNLRYQIDAVKMAIDTIEKHNGVIIADVVGLGKSIIASVVARNLDMDTIIISPPHLIDQWKSYKTQFGVNAEVFSSGKIQSALDFYNENFQNKQCLIIIDEAHRYRNPETRDYKMLHDLCMGNKVTLLSATPFNNTPSDIYAMISLFQIPSRSTLQTVANLGAEFKSLILEYNSLQSSMKKKEMTHAELSVKIGDISKKIRTIIEPLVVRRSRIDLEKISVYREDLKKQGIVFPKVADPAQQTYDLGLIKDKYIKTLNLISPIDKTSKYYYKAARYSCLSYVNEDKLDELKKELKNLDDDFDMIVGRQQSLSDFMKRLLVRRFESSVYAFYSSLRSLIDKSKEILSWAETEKKIPIYKKGTLPDPSELYGATGDEEVALANTKLKELEGKGFYTIDMKYIREDFIIDIKSDIKILEDIEKDWFPYASDDYKSFKDTDPKVTSFIKLIQEQIKHDPKRKIIVFSEFGDTVDYVYKVMKESKIKVLKYTASDASNKNKEIIKLNFDAGIQPNKQKNDYDVLIATDAISEGYSLHRAGTIFNYDIPYNPTRVIQRVGRINRINKKMFNTLYIYNYFPSIVGEAETNTMAISTLKMAMIQHIMGEDTRILTENESLNSYFVERYRTENALIESESGETKHRDIWESYLNSDLMKKARTIPHRTRIRRITNEHSGVIIFGKRGTDYVFKFRDSNGNICLKSPFDALNLFYSDENEIGKSVSKEFNVMYHDLKNNLFKDNAKDSMKDRTKALDRLKKYIRSNKDDYYEDLLMAIKDYDALPRYEVRLIWNANDKELSNLKDVISPDYIKRIFQSVNKNKNKEESIVLIEEFEEGEINV